MNKKQFDSYIRKIVREELDAQVEGIMTEAIIPAIRRAIKQVILAEKIEISFVGKTEQLNESVSTANSKFSKDELSQIVGGSRNSAPAPRNSTVVVNNKPVVVESGDRVSALKNVLSMMAGTDAPAGPANNPFITDDNGIVPPSVPLDQISRLTANFKKAV